MKLFTFTGKFYLLIVTFLLSYIGLKAQTLSFTPSGTQTVYTGGSITLALRLDFK
ncbi:MAG: hypothetical protein K2X48_02635 [Chitinophagaceae bacterium]|nr:hypothetical protein [Chitinophagaceae bacterium]